MGSQGNTESESVRRRVLYTGRVQGVGFRFTTQRVAAGYDVSGYVRNLSDGRVELVAEGREVELDRFTRAVAGAMTGYIDRADTSQAAATGEFTGFTVER